MAYSHLCRAIECMVRDDASTYQCYQIDELTGEPVRGWQGQGGKRRFLLGERHAWMIYGLAIGYRYTQEKGMLEVAKRVSNYYLNRQPSDDVCCWDLIYTDDSVQRDTSAAPVAACGLLELSKYLEDSDPLKKIYYNAGSDHHAKPGGELYHEGPEIQTAFSSTAYTARREEAAESRDAVTTNAVSGAIIFIWKD